MKRSVLLTWGLLLTVLIAASLSRLLLGDYTVSFPDFVTIVGGGNIPGARAARFIIMEDRLPRVLVGILAGAAFGVAGTIFQLLLRNPLASPDVVGISASATAFVVAAIAFAGTTGVALSVVALVGGLCGAAIVVLVSQTRLSLSVGGAQEANARFVLSGVAVAAMAVAATQFLLTRMEIRTAAAASAWISGSLNQATWQRAWVLAVVLGVVGLAIVLCVRQLHHMAVGDELAFALGIPVPVVRWVLLGLAVVLASVATAATGPISFVSFMAGPIVRVLLGGRDSLVASALMGAVIVIAADFVAANLLPAVLPVGVVTGVVGMPILLYMVARSRRVR